MDMTTFWNTVPDADLLTADQLKNTPAFAAAKQDFFDDNSVETQFAFSVIPNIEPSGATTEADEEDLDERDPNEEITDADGPSLGGETALMAYQPSIDALYLWYPEDSAWRMWNY